MRAVPSGSRELRIATVAPSRRASSTHAPCELLRWLLRQVAPSSWAALIPFCMSCMVSRLLTDLTRSADWRVAVTGPERWTGRHRGHSGVGLFVLSPGLTELSLSHARASARYFALSYAHAYASVIRIRICTAVEHEALATIDLSHFT